MYRSLPVKQTIIANLTDRLLDDDMTWWLRSGVSMRVWEVALERTERSGATPETDGVDS